MNNKIKIRKVMSPNPVTIHIEDNLKTAIEKIEQHQFDHLPVVDDSDNLQGIISKTDLYRKALNLSKVTSGGAYTNKILFVTAVAKIMTPRPIVVSPDQSIDYAMEILLQGDFHALPVVDGDAIVGILTSKDIIEYLANEKINNDD